MAPWKNLFPSSLILAKSLERNPPQDEWQRRSRPNYGGILGITSQHPEARKYIDSRLKEFGPYNKTRFYSALGMNGVQVLLAFENESVYDYFKNGKGDLENPILTDMYNKDALMGIHGIPNMPVFIYKAVQDQMSPASATDTLVETLLPEWCEYLVSSQQSWRA